MRISIYRVSGFVTSGVRVQLQEIRRRFNQDMIEISTPKDQSQKLLQGQLLIEDLICGINLNCNRLTAV